VLVCSLSLCFSARGISTVALHVTICGTGCHITLFTTVQLHQMLASHSTCHASILESSFVLRNSSSCCSCRTAVSFCVDHWSRRAAAAGLCKACTTHMSRQAGNPLLAVVCAHRPKPWR
jgi:hypothetical protein